MSNITNSLKKGIIINFIAKYSNLIIQIFITAILARILTPEDYGIITVVMVFITFFNLLGDMGLGPAIIQNKQLNKKEISDIFLFSIILAVVLSLTFYLFSYFISYYYKSNIYVNIGHLLCISVFFNTLNVVPNAVLSKKMNFKILGINSVLTNVLVGILTIILAIYGFSYYSLVINSIIQSILLFSLNYYFSKIIISFNYNKETIKKIKSYSIYQFLFNLINYFSRNLDNILTGKYLGVSSLGYYDKAYRLMIYPIQYFTFVITPVLHPVLSEYQNNKDIIYENYVRITKFLALVGVFISVFCFFSSKEIILIMFGDRWLGSVYCFKILSLSIMFQIVLSSSGSIFQATNSTKELFISGAYVALTTVTSIIIGVYLGKIEFVAMGVFIAYFINFNIVFYYLITIVFNKNFFKFLSNFKNYLLISTCMLIILKFLDFSISNYLISLMYKLFISLVLYFLLIIITGEYKILKPYIKRIVFRRGISE